MNAPRFSVVIPVFNGAQVIDRAISSVLTQTWPAHEIIVVDDGSVDDSANVVRAYGEQVRYVNQENYGVSAARNKGVEVATGDWLAFLDADDWFYPDRLRWHAEWITQDPGLDFLTGDYDYRRPDGSLIGTSMSANTCGMRMLERAKGNLRVVMTGADITDFVHAHFGDTHTLSLPKKSFVRLGGYPLGFKVCEDVHFLVSLCAVSERIGVVCEPMGAYCIHDSSVTRSDPVQSQRNNVATLENLKRNAVGFPQQVRRGVMRRLRDARLNLAYALLRTGNRWQAVAAVAPSMLEAPGWRTIRDVGAVLKG